MATRLLLLRSLLTSSVNQTLTPRSVAPPHSLGFRPVIAITNLRQSTVAATNIKSSPNHDSSPNRPPKKMLRDNGGVVRPWHVVVEKPKGCYRHEMIDSYIGTLAEVIGSNDEAKTKICSASTSGGKYAFRAFLSEEVINKLKELPEVLSVSPVCYDFDDPLMLPIVPISSRPRCRPKPKWLSNLTMHNT